MNLGTINKNISVVHVCIYLILYFNYHLDFQIIVKHLLSQVKFHSYLFKIGAFATVKEMSFLNDRILLQSIEFIIRSTMIFR